MKPIARFYHILESVQYGLLYMFSAFVGGTALDFSFPAFDPKTNQDTMTWEVLKQCVGLVIVVYLTRLFVKQVPILFPVTRGSAYVPYTTPEFNGEMMMGFVFLACQINLLQKVDFLATELYRRMLNEERYVKDKEEKLLNGMTKEKDMLRKGITAEEVALQRGLQKGERALITEEQSLRKFMSRRQ